MISTRRLYDPVAQVGRTSTRLRPVWCCTTSQPERASSVRRTERNRAIATPPGFGFAYDADTSLLEDGKTRVLGYVREVGDGSVVYWALGHCHSPATNSQPFVDTSVAEDGTTPMTFRGVWETSEFQQLLGNSISWALNS